MSCGNVTCFDQRGLFWMMAFPVYMSFLSGQGGSNPHVVIIQFGLALRFRLMGRLPTRRGRAWVPLFLGLLMAGVYSCQQT